MRALQRRRPASSRRLLAGVAAALALLAAVIAVRTARFSSRQVARSGAALDEVDGEAAAGRLAAAIRFRTVSHAEDPDVSAGELSALHGFLAHAFPRLDEHLAREELAGGALLHTWAGTDPALPAILLAAHLDVVPAEEGAWTQPPFAGAIVGGEVWGRGALDDKGTALAIHEAVELLLAGGFRPRRTVLLALGHDEEVGGTGAAAIAARLAERGVKVAFALDEGGAVTDGVVPGVAAPVALVGIAEKGQANLALEVKGAAGHSSRPPPETAIGILAAALHRVERARFPARLAGATRALFECAGPEMAWPRRAALANLWLTGPVLLRTLAGSPSTDAAIRTTIAPTIFEAGTAANVLPAQARAVVNVRILPGDTIAAVVDHVRRAAADPRVAVTLLPGASEPSPVASTRSEGFLIVEQAVRDVFPEAVVAPYLVLAATDGRHHARLTPDVYRFLPVRLGGRELARIHGVDERVPVASHRRAVQFYARLIRTAAG